MLDLTDNQIFKVQCIENLKKLPDLAEVNLKNNPICVHSNINDMILEMMPKIEVINELAIKEAGQRYKENKEKIMRNL